ncbi:MAG: hypothetical protein Q8P67_29020 [archaeon]|nr:hypothetical protein [archaeon]
MALSQLNVSQRERKRQFYSQNQPTIEIQLPNGTIRKRRTPEQIILVHEFRNSLALEIKALKDQHQLPAEHLATLKRMQEELDLRAAARREKRLAALGFSTTPTSSSSVQP